MTIRATLIIMIMAGFGLIGYAAGLTSDKSVRVLESTENEVIVEYSGKPLRERFIRVGDMDMKLLEQPVKVRMNSRLADFKLGARGIAPKPVVAAPCQANRTWNRPERSGRLARYRSPACLLPDRQPPRRLLGQTAPGAPSLDPEAP